MNPLLHGETRGSSGGSILWIFLGGLDTNNQQGIGYGLIGAMVGTVVFMYCAELFPTSVRNLGVGISYNVGFGLFGGFAPLVAEASLQWLGCC